jgi:hypothetical protein
MFFDPSIGKTPVRDDPRVEHPSGPCACGRQYARHTVHAGEVYENMHAKWHMYRCSENSTMRSARPERGCLPSTVPCLGGEVNRFREAGLRRPWHRRRRGEVFV